MARFILCILFICVLQGLNYGQRGFEVGGNVGAAWYFGDINNEFRLNSPGWSIGPAVRFNWNERLCAKVGINYLLLRGYDYKSDNIYQKARNLSVNTHVFDLGFQMELNFMTYYHGSRDDWFTPYMLFGGNVIRHEPTAKYEDKWRSLRPLGTEGQRYGKEYSTFTGAWSIGIGLKMDLSPEWSLNFEFASRQTFTDYLDDVSKTYPVEAQLLADRGQMAVDLSDRSIIIPGVNDGPIGISNRQRGDNDAKDSYATFTIGLMYYFAQVRCPKIIKL